VKPSSRIVTSLAAIEQREWDELDHAHNPFLSYAFLNALEVSGSVC